MTTNELIARVKSRHGLNNEKLAPLLGVGLRSYMRWLTPGHDRSDPHPSAARLLALLDGRLADDVRAELARMAAMERREAAEAELRGEG